MLPATGARLGEWDESSPGPPPLGEWGRGWAKARATPTTEHTPVEARGTYATQICARGEVAAAVPPGFVPRAPLQLGAWAQSPGCKAQCTAAAALPCTELGCTSPQPPWGA